MKTNYFFLVLLISSILLFDGCDVPRKNDNISSDSIEENYNSDLSKGQDMKINKYDSDELERLLNNIINSAKGDWSIYVEALSEDECMVEINNKEIRAASSIKLFNMASLYNEIENGNVYIDEKLQKNLDSMITVSSNVASNAVVRSIGNGDFITGAKIVTDFAEDAGCIYTQEQHPLYDVSGPASGKNTTSVEDCGLLLKKIYKEKCVSEQYDKEMINILKKQTRNNKIPSGIPDNVVVAHKTGENSKVEIDVGIVYSPKCDYIICISVTQFNASVYNTFSEISKTVYEYFNK